MPCPNYLQVIEAGARILQGETSIRVPHGLARFCSGPTWAEAGLSASLYKAATSRYLSAPLPFGLLHTDTVSSTECTLKHNELVWPAICKLCACP